MTTAVAEAMEIKRDRFQFTGLGRNKTLLMLFFNSSLRTRLSTQKAAMNLGMNVMVLDVNQGAWRLETERGVVMDGDKVKDLKPDILLTTMITFISLKKSENDKRIGVTFTPYNDIVIEISHG